MSQLRTIRIEALAPCASLRWLPRFVPLLLVSVIVLFGGCERALPECGGSEVKSTIASLFRRQFKLTPYVRYIDFDKSELNVEAVFSIKDDRASRSCVAFVRYNAKLNDQGQAAQDRNNLTYSLLYELANEKQVYYGVSRGTDGRVEVKIERVGG